MKKLKKLSLHKESLRNLDPQEVQEVDGAGIPITIPPTGFCSFFGCGPSQPRVLCLSAHHVC